MSKILIIGSSGFIGQSLLKYDWKKHSLTCPNSHSVNLTNKKQLRQAVSKVDTIINLAAYTDTKTASLDESGPAWKTNVLGVRYLSEMCQSFDKHLIHISTNAIFPNYLANKESKNENANITPDPNNMSPYGYTKLLGEIEALKNKRTTILRISYPFGNTDFKNKDYILKILNSINAGVPLFNDQSINLTHIDQLYGALKLTINNNKIGVFHIVSSDDSTPYDIYKYLNRKLNLNRNIKPVSVSSIKKGIYNHQETISTTLTEQSLNLVSPSIFEGIEKFIESNKDYFTNQR